MVRKDFGVEHQADLVVKTGRTFLGFWFWDALRPPEIPVIFRISRRPIQPIKTECFWKTMKSDYFLAPPHKNKGSRDKYKHHVGYLVGNLGMFSTMSSWIFPGCFFVVFYPSLGAPCFFGRVLVLKIHKKPFGLPRRSIHFSTLTNAYQYQKHFQGTMLPNILLDSPEFVLVGAEGGKTVVISWSKVLPRKVVIADLEVAPAISKNRVLMSKSRGGLKIIMLNVQGRPVTSYK